MKYRVLQKSFIGNTLREVDDIVDYDGDPGPNLAPLESPQSDEGEAKNPPPKETKQAAKPGKASTGGRTLAPEPMQGDGNDLA